MYHNLSVILTLTKGMWACKGMFTCTGKYRFLEKLVKTRNFAPATHCKPSTSSRRWRSTVCLQNTYWNFSLGRWKEAVYHGNNSGGWRHVFWVGWTHQTTVEWWWDPGLLRKGSGVPAQWLGSLVGDNSWGGLYHDNIGRLVMFLTCRIAYGNYHSLTKKEWGFFWLMFIIEMFNWRKPVETRKIFLCEFA